MRIKKKKSKSFVVSINDTTREVFVEKTVEKTVEETKKVEIPSFKQINQNIKLNTVLGKKSSLISINRLPEENGETVGKDKSQLIVRDKDFSENKLQEIWKDLLSFIKEKGKSNLVITLGAYQPKLKEDYLIELSLSNAAQAEMILEEKYMILECLRNKLENDNIEITTKIVEGERSNIPYTNKEKF
jgi:hypothetical protein